MLEKERYIVQWVTKWDDNNHITQILGYCVRDMDKFDKNIVFEHEDEVVCKKVCEILNEGANKC